jgi:DNA-binding transcriptional ArsR family regulator
MPFAPLDPILHNQLRLAVVSLLVSLEEADFTFILEKTGATRGNLSVQITNLQDAGYVKITKSFKDNYPNTKCQLTAKGVKAFEIYVKAIKEYLRT